ncbi:hypothetical protein D1164_20600 [Mariniphaga sediminis]|uniref:Uncharacterized protein n=1 Tax=Mariniphaga sediminis TaxID=1628158 RepID=A0A399CTL4_9BACT|nr:hypothetical protein D1164_20600 [Mariniphaga sediminis]
MMRKTKHEEGISEHHVKINLGVFSMQRAGPTDGILTQPASGIAHLKILMENVSENRLFY